MEIVRLFFGSMVSGDFLGDDMPFNGYAIRHPQGIVVVDTSFGHQFGPGIAGTLEGVAPGQGFPWVARRSEDALADHGIRPDEVALVINTHLWDHAGDNYRFPNATFVVQRPELELARQGKTAAERVAPEFLTTEPFDFDGAKFELLDSEDKEVLPGVTCLFTPGHTSGHQSVLVDDEGTSVLIVGDAVYTSAIWNDLDTMTPEHPAWGSQIMTDLQTWRASAAKLKALGADVVHFAHDPKILGWNA